MIQNQIVKSTITLITCFMVMFLVLASLAMAQEPSPFKISLIPQDKQAASGSRFFYTVVVTNVSAIAVKQAIVSVEMPEGTTFFDSNGGDVNWLSKEPAVGSQGRVVWFNPNGVVKSGEVITFQLIVDVLPQTAGKKLVNEAYTLIGEENVKKTGSGPTVEVPVFTPTPTPTSTPLPTATPTLSSAQAQQTRQAEATKAAANATPTPPPAKPSSSWPCFGGMVIMSLLLAAAMVVGNNK